MILIDDYKKILNDTRPQLKDLELATGYESLGVEIEELELHTHQPDFWEDKEKQDRIFGKLKILRGKKEGVDEIKRIFSDFETMIELYEELEDEEMEGEIISTATALQEKVEQLRLTTLLTGEYDSNNAIITLHAGAGGTESQDWAEMLFRMYTRYCQKMGYKTTTIDYLDGDEAGIKSVSFSVEGANAYGFLKGKTVCTG